MNPTRIRPYVDRPRPGSRLVPLALIVLLVVIAFSGEVAAQAAIGRASAYRPIDPQTVPACPVARAEQTP